MSIALTGNRPALSPLRWASLWLPVLIWAGLIFYLSTIPHLRFFRNAFLDFTVRKLGHAGVYGILARLLARAFTGSTFWPWKKIFAWSLALAVLYAATDEYHQTFIAGRVGSIRDVTIDGVGGWLALGLRP